jgi:hypothetical protein
MRRPARGDGRCAAVWYGQIRAVRQVCIIQATQTGASRSTGLLITCYTELTAVDGMGSPESKE